MDHEALYWDIRGRPAVDQSQRDTDWDSWTCQLGFGVMGIWSDNMDGTDINAVHRSARGGHIVAVSKDHEFCSRNEELCIKNEEWCIKNEEL